MVTQDNERYASGIKSHWCWPLAKRTRCPACVRDSGQGPLRCLETLDSSFHDPPPPIVVSPKRSIPTKVTYDSFPSLEVAVWLRTQVSLRPTHRLLPPPSESGPGYRVSPFRILRVGQVGILTRALIPGRAAFGGQVLPWSCHGLRETRWYIKRSYLRYCPPSPSPATTTAKTTQVLPWTKLRQRSSVTGVLSAKTTKTDPVHQPHRYPTSISNSRMQRRWS